MRCSFIRHLMLPGRSMWSFSTFSSGGGSGNSICSGRACFARGEVFFFRTESLGMAERSTLASATQMLETTFVVSCVGMLKTTFQHSQDPLHTRALEMRRLWKPGDGFRFAVVCFLQQIAKRIHLLTNIGRWLVADHRCLTRTCCTATHAIFLSSHSGDGTMANQLF